MLYLEKGTSHLIVSGSYPLLCFSAVLTSNMVSTSSLCLRLLPQLLTHHLAYKYGVLETFYTKQRVRYYSQINFHLLGFLEKERTGS